MTLTSVGAFAGCTASEASRQFGDTPLEPSVDGASIRALLLAEARSNYTYGPPRAPDTVQAGAPGTLPTMTIASAAQTSAAGRYPGSRFIGRIVSSAAYDTLGIAPDTNYLWTDSVATWASDSGPSRVLLVPQDPAYPMVWLRVDSVHADTTPTVEPLLHVISGRIVACSDGCPTGHCGNTRKWRPYDPSRDNPTMRIAGS